MSSYHVNVTDKALLATVIARETTGVNRSATKIDR